MYYLIIVSILFALFMQINRFLNAPVEPKFFDSNSIYPKIGFDSDYRLLFPKNQNKISLGLIYISGFVNACVLFVIFWIIWDFIRLFQQGYTMGGKNILIDDILGSDIEYIVGINSTGFEDFQKICFDILGYFKVYFLVALSLLILPFVEIEIFNSIKSKIVSLLKKDKSNRYITSIHRYYLFLCVLFVEPLICFLWGFTGFFGFSLLLLAYSIFVGGF